jgi:hypothetical protein
VYVDGRRVADETPVDHVPVAPGPHKITVFNPDRKRSSAPRTVMVAPGETQAVSIKW